MILDGAVEVLPDVTGIDKTFHYSTERLGRPVELGTIVRVALHGRRVRGWVVAVDSPAPDGVELQPVLEIVSCGPPPEVVELCRWAAWRYAGRLRAALVAASPERVVRTLPVSAPAVRLPPHEPSPLVDAAVADAIAAGDAVLRLPPTAQRFPVVEAALSAGAGQALVLCESRADVEVLARRLRHRGWPVAVHPEEWGLSSRVVIGTRNSAFAPLTPTLTLVLDAQSGAYRSERAPTFDARVIAAERSARSGGSIVLVTPCPTLELLAAPGRRLVRVPESVERRGWPSLGVLDRREEDPAEGGYSSELVSWIRDAVNERSGPPVLCVLNRTGRARLLACGMCKAVQRCPACGGAQILEKAPEPGEIGRLSCPRCGDRQPAICPSCGSARLRILRPGVARAREQLEAVTGLAVGEVSGPRAAVPDAPVIVGTEAVLHRARAASMVAWLDFDQHLLAPRFRAAEEALGLLARSARLVAGESSGGRPRLVVRTSLPDHEVVRAASTGDPGLVTEAESVRRELIGLPPVTALATVEGAGAPELVFNLRPRVTASLVGELRYLLRADRADVLADELGRIARLGADGGPGPGSGSGGGFAALDVRIEMDPVDL